MLELLKLLTDAAVLRDSARKGILTWRPIVAGLLFAVLEYAIALPAVLYWSNHPSFKPWFLAAMALVLLNFFVFMFFAIRWYVRAIAAAKEPAQSSPQPGA